MKRKLLISLSLGVVMTLCMLRISYAQELIDSVATAHEFHGNAPTVDGTIDPVWDELEYIHIRNKVDGEDPFDNDDFSGKFKIGWKGNLIYILVDITDDVIVADPTFAHKQDACELYVDLKLDGEGYVDEFAFYKTINADGSAIGGRTQDGWDPPAVGMDVAVGTKTGGWIAEWSIDVNSFGIAALEADVEIGIDISINDRDDIAVDARKTQLTWSARSDGSNWQTPVGNNGLITLATSTVSVPMIAENHISIFPNPAKESIQINQDTQLVEIFAITGALVKSFRNVPANTSLQVDDLSGLYLIKATSHDGLVFGKKLIINR